MSDAESMIQYGIVAIPGEEYARLKGYKKALEEIAGTRVHTVPSGFGDYECPQCEDLVNMAGKALETENRMYIEEAFGFAAAAHFGQKRRYTGEDYFVHCVEVEKIVVMANCSGNVRVAALLHDVLEDTEITEGFLRQHFPAQAVDWVVALTDVELGEGNRATRKQKDRERLASSCSQVQTIKYADIISNTPSIAEHDPGFAKLYLSEVSLSLEVMTEGKSELRDRAIALVHEKEKDSNE